MLKKRIDDGTRFWQCLCLTCITRCTLPHVTVTPPPPQLPRLGGVAPHTGSVIRISAVVEAARSFVQIWCIMWIVYVPSLALNVVFGLTPNSIIINSLTNLAIYMSRTTLWKYINIKRICFFYPQIRIYLSWWWFLHPWLSVFQRLSFFLKMNWID